MSGPIWCDGRGCWVRLPGRRLSPASGRPTVRCLAVRRLAAPRLAGRGPAVQMLEPPPPSTSYRRCVRTPHRRCLPTRSPTRISGALPLRPGRRPGLRTRFIRCWAHDLPAVALSGAFGLLGVRGAGERRLGRWLRVWIRWRPLSHEGPGGRHGAVARQFEVDLAGCGRESGPTRGGLRQLRACQRPRSPGTSVRSWRSSPARAC